MGTSRTSGLLLVLLLLRRMFVVTEETDSAENVDKPSLKELAEAQVDWLRANGGFYSSKISIDPLFESNDTNVPLGMFAKESFVKGEKIITIPRSCLLTAGSSQDPCQTTMNLLHEHMAMENGGSSDFAPYVAYLFSRANGGDGAPLPSSWSSKGKTLLTRIRGEHLPPEDLTTISFANHCGGTGKYKLEEFAYRTVVSRAWTDKLVPVLDMMNHQSGRFMNVDSTRVHGSDDITVFATRDIAANEQLYLSYMDCIDEKGFENEYVLPQMLRDFGYVDRYPQRWTFPYGPGSEYNLVFDLDSLDGEGVLLDETSHKHSELSITWRTNEPDIMQLEFLSKELSRLKDLQSYVTTALDELDSSHECSVVLEYYQSLTTALSFVTESWNATTHGNSSNVTRKESRAPTDNKQEDWMACNGYHNIDFELVHHSPSFHQYIEVYHAKNEDDACLYLDGYLHACASSRPHYHEVFVHYPARYLNQVERVIFIGGGDSMVLHEVLKYPDLELVVGLELDDQVTRSTFMNFGIQPHWDDPRVQWYYGDAAKSMSILPQDYYGSFDLVIVDILTEVAANLKVNDELNFMDAAMLLMKPEGIIVKNEDEGYVPGGPKSDFTKYSVDIVYRDVPLYCLQVFVVGSNSIDFLTAIPKDHGVDTLYLEDIDGSKSQFDCWYNFGNEECDERSLSDDNDNDNVSNTGTLTEVRAESLGVLMVLEAEKTTGPINSTDTLHSAITKALHAMDLVESDFVCSPPAGEQAELKRLSFIVHLGEHGYIAARCFPFIRYCAFDIQLYGSSIVKLDLLQKQLLSIVGSDRYSLYRFVTPGTTVGEPQGSEELLGPPSTRGQYENVSDGSQESPPGTKIRKRKAAEEFESPKAATLHSYDNSRAIEQWKSQVTIGAQVFVTFKIPPSLDIALVSSLFSKALTTLGMGSIFDQKQGASDEPDGGLVRIATWTDGTLVATYDGHSRVDFNLFTSSNDLDVDEALREIAERGQWRVVAYHSFPRGVGSVVNFNEDIEGIERPLWA